MKKIKYDYNYLSKCCNANVFINFGDEGTNYYICDKCKQPCDIVTNQNNEREEIWENLSKLFIKHQNVGGIRMSLQKEVTDYVQSYTQKKVRGEREKCIEEIRQLLDKQQPVEYRKDNGAGWAIPCKDIFALIKYLSVHKGEIK